MKSRVSVLIVVILLFALVSMSYAASLTPQDITTSGIVVTPTTGTATAFEFANTGNEFIYVNNGSGAELTVAVTIPGVVGGFALTDLSVTVVTDTIKLIGPFNPTYANAADGNVDFTISAATSVGVAVLRLP